MRKLKPVEGVSIKKMTYYSAFNRLKEYTRKVDADRQTAREKKKLDKILRNLNSIYFNLVALIGCYTFEFTFRQYQEFTTLKTAAYERITFLIYRFSGQKNNPAFYPQTILIIANQLTDLITIAKQVNKVEYHPDSDKLDWYMSAINDNLAQLRYITGVKNVQDNAPSLIFHNLNIKTA